MPIVNAAPDVTAFIDETTSTVSYVVADMGSKVCAIIDPVLEFEESSAEITTHGVEKILEHLQVHGLSWEFILETHAHADHVSVGYLFLHSEQVHLSALAS